MTSLGRTFGSGPNCLNFLRLCLALVVLLAHAYTLSGLGDDAIGHVSRPGTLAVYGFFALSGFLVTGSAERSSTLGYLRKRCLRIYPAFWAALLVTAFVIAPVGVLLQNSGTGCGVGCWLTGPDSALGYLAKNITLVIHQNGIAGTPTDVIVPNVWNASLWTLKFEFACYLLVLVMARVGILSRPRLVVLLTLGAWTALLVATAVPAISSQLNPLTHPLLTPGLVLVPVFLAGSCLWVLRESVPYSGRLAAACLVLFVLVQFLPIGQSTPSLSLTTGGLAAPLLAYPLLWVGLRLHFISIGRRHDYSYGVYLYAFPIEQALLIAGVGTLGFGVYTALTVALTFAFAFASWHLIESRAMRWKRPRTSAQPASGEPHIQAA